VPRTASLTETKQLLRQTSLHIINKNKIETEHYRQLLADVNSNFDSVFGLVLFRFYLGLVKRV